MKLLRTGSIRTRLLLAYVGILVLGFGALTLVAGRQISLAARADYEQRLLNEIRLVAQGIAQYTTNRQPFAFDLPIDEILRAYENQIGGRLAILQVDDALRPMRPITYSPEIEAALRGGITIVQRRNEEGKPTLFTAARFWDFARRSAVVQLSIPVENLELIVRRRWATLLLIYAVVTAGAVGAALLLSRSIIQPLHKLRDSAVQLARGDFGHRVDYDQRDEIGEVARAFNEMAQQVESMLEEQRAFASNTSHELRTPLTTIRLRTEALRYDKHLEAALTQQYITEIDDEVRRLGALIEDLTLLSRLDAGRAELGHNEIDLRRFAHSLRQQMQPQASAKALTLEISTAPTPQAELPVQASLSHLTIVFRNLLDNAIKYTPPGGKITWSLWLAEPYIHSRIQDTGTGIDSAHLPHLFERFYRADKARSRGTPGTGLGLAIVKSVVEAYGGQVSIHSEGQDKGVCVWVRWPLSHI